MWKDSYIVGVDFIDKQHKELFDTTERLLKILESEDAQERKQESANVVEFLKNYADKHFAEEEAYHQTIAYSDMEAHKTLHRIFTDTVLRLEKKLIENDYGVPILKEITGFLTSWLTYHVVGVDQKLKKQEELTGEKAAVVTSYIDCFAKSAAEVLDTMAGVTAKSASFTNYSGSFEDIRIMIGLIGDNKGEAVFTFTKQLAFRLIKTMTKLDMTEVDEFVYSALCEMSNIISGNASIRIQSGGKEIDITTPKIIKGFTGQDNRSGVYLETELGRIAVSVNVA